MPDPPPTGSDYGESVARGYARGRRMSRAMLSLWMDRVASHTTGLHVRRALDLGCGTGRFTPHLASALSAPVIGIDRSSAMLDVARRARRRRAVTYLQAEASRMPLRSATCDVAWLSMVAHHVGDLTIAARELHRVVAPGGVVLVRNSFRGRLESVFMYRYFPSALAADEKRLPSMDGLRTAFEASGLVWQCLDEVVQVIDTSVGDHVERLRLRATSSFAFVPDDEFDRGLRAMESAVGSGEHMGPVKETIDLVVFKRPG